MSIDFKKFDSIEQYRQAIRSVHDYCYRRDIAVKPTLKFVGTVKVHGTNAGIAYNAKTGELKYQSRERTITPQSDNNGFAMWAYSDIGKIAIGNVIESTIEYFNDNNMETVETIYIYGEWAGKGIQKGVAVSELDKKYYIFRIEVNGKPLDISTFTTENFDPTWSVFSIFDFPTYEIEIDFNTPELYQNQLVELTMAVEEECPVAKKFGVSGVGEGIVWYNIETGVIFKTKGEKHSVSKVKSLKQIAPVDIEKINKLNEFIDYAVTENRLNQGLVKMEEMGYDVNDNRTIGQFIKWVANDVFKEEIDVIANSGLDSKALGSKIAEKSRQFFMNRV